MTDVETKIDVATEDFTEELSDEVLDREGAAGRGSWACSTFGPNHP